MSYISIFLSCQSWVLDILKAKLKNSKKQKTQKTNSNSPHLKKKMINSRTSKKDKLKKK